MSYPPGLQAQPRIDPRAFVAHSATLIGDVTIEADASVWFGVVLRADQNGITVGAGSNVQDNTVVHCDRSDLGGDPVVIGSGVTIGHGCVLHGCTVGDGSLVGNGSVVLDGASLGECCLVGAGSVVPPSLEVPPRCLAVGNPCKVKRPLRDDEMARLAHPAEVYRGLTEAYRQDNRFGASR